MFKQYREAYDEMQADTKVLDVRERIEELQDQLRELESPYRERMAAAEKAIVEAVLAQKQTTTLFNIKASYTTGKRSTSWKSVATEMKAPDDVIEKYTKIGDPFVKIEVL